VFDELTSSTLIAAFPASNVAPIVTGTPSHLFDDEQRIVFKTKPIVPMQLFPPVLSTKASLDGAVDDGGTDLTTDTVQALTDDRSLTLILVRMSHSI
jgi:hypothetical protein